MGKNDTLIWAGVVIGGIFLFRKQIEEFLGGFGKASSGLGSGIGTAGSGLGSGIGTAGSEAGDTLKSIFDFIQSVFNQGTKVITTPPSIYIPQSDPKPIDLTPKKTIVGGKTYYTGNDPYTGLPLQEIGNKVLGQEVYGYSSPFITGGVGATTGLIPNQTQMKLLNPKEFAKYGSSAKPDTAVLTRATGEKIFYNKGKVVGKTTR